MRSLNRQMNDTDRTGAQRELDALVAAACDTIASQIRRPAAPPRDTAQPDAVTAQQAPAEDVEAFVARTIAYLRGRADGEALLLRISSAVAQNGEGDAAVEKGGHDEEAPAVEEPPMLAGKSPRNRRRTNKVRS